MFSSKNEFSKEFSADSLEKALNNILASYEQQNKENVSNVGKMPSEISELFKEDSTLLNFSFDNRKDADITEYLAKVAKCLGPDIEKKINAQNADEKLEGKELIEFAKTLQDNLRSAVKNNKKFYEKIISPYQSMPSPQSILKASTTTPVSNISTPPTQSSPTSTPSTQSSQNTTSASKKRATSTPLKPQTPTNYGSLPPQEQNKSLQSQYGSISQVSNPQTKQSTSNSTKTNIPSSSTQQANTPSQTGNYASVSEVLKHRTNTAPVKPTQHESFSPAPNETLQNKPVTNVSNLSTGPAPTSQTQDQSQTNKLNVVKSNLISQQAQMPIQHNTSSFPTILHASKLPTNTTTLTAQKSAVVTPNPEKFTLTDIKQNLEQAVDLHNKNYSTTPKPNDFGGKVNWTIDETANKLTIKDDQKNIGIVTKDNTTESIKYEFSDKITFDTADIVLRASKDPELTLSSRSITDIESILKAANTPPNNEGDNKKTIVLDDSTREFLQKQQKDKLPKIIQDKLTESDPKKVSPAKN